MLLEAGTNAVGRGSLVADRLRGIRLPIPASFPLVLASILWGTTGTAAAFLDSVGPLAIGASTMVVGGALLCASSARGAASALRDRASRPWLLLGALGVAVYPLSFYSAMDLAGVAVGNVVALGSGPVFAALFEWIWERQALRRRGAASTALAVVGVVLLGFGGRADAAGIVAVGGAVLAGVLLGLAAGFSYALYTYSAIRAIRHGHGGRAVMGGTFGLGAVGLLPILIVTGAPLLSSPANVGIAAYLAIGPMFVAYLLFANGLGKLRSSAVTTVTLIEPVVATLLAVVILSERLTLAGWLGAALVLAGVSLLSSSRPGAGSTAPAR